MKLSWVTSADVDALAQAHALAFDPPWSAEAFGELLATPGVYGLLVSRDAPLGLALCRTVVDEMEVLTIGVAPDARRSGVARALMMAVLDTARQAAVTAVFLEVAADNVAACALYAGLGFRREGLRRAYYDRGPQGSVDALVMRLDLQPPAP